MLILQYFISYSNKTKESEAFLEILIKYSCMKGI